MCVCVFSIYIDIHLERYQLLKSGSILNERGFQEEKNLNKVRGAGKDCSWKYSTDFKPNQIGSIYRQEIMASQT